MKFSRYTDRRSGLFWPFPQLSVARYAALGTCCICSQNFRAAKAGSTCLDLVYRLEISFKEFGICASYLLTIYAGAERRRRSERRVPRRFMVEYSDVELLNGVTTKGKRDDRAPSSAAWAAGSPGRGAAWAAIERRRAGAGGGARAATLGPPPSARRPPFTDGSMPRRPTRTRCADFAVLSLREPRIMSLRISGSGCEDALSSGSSSECEEGPPHGPHQDFPVEILPNLFLGNSTNSEDCDALARHNIKYVLNVTPDLPNTFESAGGGIHYLKIPIADHWSQNLAVHFPQAIRFIDEAMSARVGVLVHCVAGVSRSVTVTLAYLMQRHRLSLCDAFELVRARKTDIAPNFHFMRQLHSFERDLGLHERSASLTKVLEDLGVRDSSAAPDSGALSASADSGAPLLLRGGGVAGAAAAAARGAAPCGCAPQPLGVSPDSGIEFDRWSAARDTPQ
ncbi:Dual specificity protein phosphatase 9 [Eumeta japonica]|uniref:protein-tyrosine-phosphatase n=1 Tax=Eumeta variegata TaxID=151549 RepID=A0A4C1ZZX9_EUMVA|nr:Dual specificity protein phosphatase 9 [Eumeta japonica]